MEAKRSSVFLSLICLPSRYLIFLLILFLTIPALWMNHSSFGQGQTKENELNTYNENGEHLFLIRVERIDQEDLIRLLDGGVPVVMEMLHCLFVEGTLEHLTWLRSQGYSSTILDDQPQFSDYLIIGLGPDSDMETVHALGKIIHEEENWILVRLEQSVSPEILSMAKIFVTRMPHEPMSRPKPLDIRWKRYLSSRTEGFSPADPLVQKIVDQVNTADIQQFWEDLTANPPTGSRYSTSQGCQDAADYCYDLYTSFGLPTEYHEYNPSHSPNVIGTQEGALYPDNVYIIEGHLDDMPQMPPAPGADDNASGSVTSLEAANVMSCWAFKNTVKYMVVTGEELGLLGSDAYADRAEAEGENILGVINMDMNGWEGDGIPTPENLDVNYNGPSRWLGELFDECSQKYNTGLVVDDFYCPSLSASDHWPFWQKGWSAICGITDNQGYCGHGGYYPYYHESTDTIENCGDPTLFYNAVKTSVATLAELAQPFKITMTKPYFACGKDIELVLGDWDLDIDPGSQETIVVEVWSDTEQTPESVTLTERGVSSMIFDGAIPTNENPPIEGDGILSIAPGDLVVTRYIDDLDCDGATGVTYISSAQIECTKPVISDVDQDQITDTSARIKWITDEESTTVVHWGEVQPPSATSTNLTLVTNHHMDLTGLQECTLYYYSVESEDLAGNIATDDNESQYYHFETLGDFGSGLEQCHAGRVAVDKDIYICSETMAFDVVDMDLNNDPTMTEMATLNVTSTTEAEPEIVAVTETGPNTSRFTGSIQLDQGNAIPDGILQVNDGDMVTVTYLDLDDGTGAEAVSYDTAVMDCTGPIIHNLRLTDITDQRLTVRFETENPGNTVVEWGSTPGLGEMMSEPDLRTSHNVLLKHLHICEPYYMRVSSSDEYGNTSVADNNGEPYLIHTWDIPGLYWQETFEGDVSGWSMNGEWQIGPPQGLGGTYYLWPDPEEAYNNDNVMGDDLAGLGLYPGDYEDAITETSLSPSLDASSWTDTKLLLYRYLNVQFLDVSTIKILEKNNEYEIFNNNNVSINDDIFSKKSFDVGGVVDGKKSIQLEFELISDMPSQPDDGFTSGWNIDDIIFKDGTLPDYGACGNCGVTPSFNGATDAFDNNACDADGVSISWDQAVSWGTGESGTYALYRDMVPDFIPSGTNLVAAGLTGFSYNDLSAPTDQDLYYLVLAENDETCSGGPNNGGVMNDNFVYVSVTETTSWPTPEGVITLRASMLNHAHVRLNWEATSGATSYRIYRSDTPNGTFAFQDETQDLVYDDHHQQEDSNSYYYVVKGVNPCGVEGP